MSIRNSTYTVCNNKEFELSIDSEGNFVLYSFNDLCDGVNFHEVIGRPGLLKGNVNKTQITNAFSVSTYAKYKSYIFQVDRFENGRFRLSTDDHKVYKKLGLNMVDRGWYDTWVSSSEIESIWEERKLSGINLPFPKNIEKRKEIQLDLI